MRRGDSPSRCARCLYYFRAGSTFLFSHIGLCGLVVGYAIMGAFAFEALESANEEEKRKEMARAGAQLVEKIWTFNVENPMFFKDNWTLNISDELKLFELKLVTAMRKEGWDGNEVGENQWSFSGALLYSIIVITTIGYGNIAPKTDYGKMVTILYAIVGIPLMLLCLSNIGDAMAHSFKFMYWKLCCYLCIKPKKRRKSHHRSFRQQQRYASRDPDSMIFEYGGKNDYAHMQPGPGPGGQLSPNNVPTSSYGGGGSMGPGHLPTMPPSNYPMSHSHSTYDRYSDHVDARQVPIISNKYILTDDIPAPSHIDHHTSTMPRPTASPSALSPSMPYGRSETLPRTRSNNRQPLKGGRGGGWGDERVDIDFENDSDSEDSDEEEQISVPIWLCLAIVVGYICGGACLFMIWEDWGFLDSSYFCFVTLTTIGFGDLVPGTAVLSNDAQLTLSLCALYLLFGMALLAMSFNLVQEEVTKSVKSVGKRLGILSDDDEDN